MNKNIDQEVVDDFGKEWTKFDQSGVPQQELLTIFQKYFSIFSFAALPKNSEGFDLGCGSGRWAYFCASRVGTLHCIDPSELALNVTKKKLEEFSNCHFHTACVDNIPLKDNSMDFGYSLGVLHHIPNTQEGLSSCVRKLKQDAPFLLYLYYGFDNKPFWYKLVWKISDLLRCVISKAPYPIKYTSSQVIALIVYLPLSRISRMIEWFGLSVTNFPLSSYRNESFITLRTDALDRFGTRLEQRFTKKQIEAMMVSAGLGKIQFREEEPFWCAIGYRT